MSTLVLRPTKHYARTLRVMRTGTGYHVGILSGDGETCFGFCTCDQGATHIYRTDDEAYLVVGRAQILITHEEADRIRDQFGIEVVQP